MAKKRKRVRSGGVKLSHEERAVRRKEIATFVKGGGKPTDAVSKFGVSLDTVKNACQENRVACIIIPKEHTHFSTLRIIALLQNTDRSQPDIAKQFGVSRERISGLKSQAIEAGILFPNRPEDERVNNGGANGNKRKPAVMTCVRPQTLAEFDAVNDNGCSICRDPNCTDPGGKH